MNKMFRLILCTIVVLVLLGCDATLMQWKLLYLPLTPQEQVLRENLVKALLLKEAKNPPDSNWASRLAYQLACETANYKVCRPSMWEVDRNGNLTGNWYYPTDTTEVENNNGQASTLRDN
jgi:hypothetical protein